MNDISVKWSSSLLTYEDSKMMKPISNTAISDYVAPAISKGVCLLRRYS